MNYKEWVKYWNKWIKDCKQELKDKGHNPKEWEICENGQCHYLSSLVITEKGYVTPWNQSKWYKD